MFMSVLLTIEQFLDLCSGSESVSGSVSIMNSIESDSDSDPDADKII